MIVTADRHGFIADDGLTGDLRTFDLPIYQSDIKFAVKQWSSTSLVLRIPTIVRKAYRMTFTCSVVISIFTAHLLCLMLFKGSGSPVRMTLKQCTA